MGVRGDYQNNYSGLSSEGASMSTGSQQNSSDIGGSKPNKKKMTGADKKAMFLGKSSKSQGLKQGSLGSGNLNN
jgi:hypothetical protein